MWWYRKQSMPYSPSRQTQIYVYTYTYSTKTKVGARALNWSARGTYAVRGHDGTQVEGNNIYTTKHHSRYLSRLRHFNGILSTATGARMLRLSFTPLSHLTPFISIYIHICITSSITYVCSHYGEQLYIIPQCPSVIKNYVLNIIVKYFPLFLFTVLCCEYYSSFFFSLKLYTDVNVGQWPIKIAWRRWLSKIALDLFRMIHARKITMIYFAV